MSKAAGLLMAITASRPRRKPTAPTNTNNVGCPAGWIGGGIYYTRTVTWNVGNQTWDVGQWQEVANYCQRAEMRFYTPNFRFNPRRKGKFIQEGLQQVYDPDPVNDSNGFGYVMDLHMLVICPDDQSRRSRLTIQLSGAGVGGALVTPIWDRDYSYFPPQIADAAGRCFWDVPNGEWTDNGTSFTVDVKLN